MKPRLTWRLAPTERYSEHRSRQLRFGQTHVATVGYHVPSVRWYWAAASNASLGIAHRNSFEDGLLYRTTEAACTAAREYIVQCMSSKAQP